MAESVITCRFCGAASNQDPIVAMRKIQGCNNCKLDISQKGRWTNVGWRIREALATRWGVPHVEVAEARAWEEAQRVNAGNSQVKTQERGA